MSYAEFLLGLDLKIDIRELDGAAEIDRAAQMTQRTNQFNFTTRRYTTAQFRDAIGTASLHALTAFVSDRYGDYGQVGLMTYNVNHDALRINNFLLSCRALGKGVEHAMMARLGEVASVLSLSFVEIEYIPTANNLPAWEFFKSIGPMPLDTTNKCSIVCRLPATVAANIHYSSPMVDPQDAQREVRVSLPKPSAPPVAVDYQWIASLCLDPLSILEVVEAAQGQGRRSASVSRALPRTELERNLTHVWERILRISPVGVHDNFFDLGGSSLLAVSVIAELNSRLGHDLPLVSLIEAPTIAELARRLRSHATEASSRCVVPLKRSGSRPPLYCVHGVGGSILELMDLAGQVHPDQPFYGIQAAGLADPSPAVNITVEEMSLRYIREIREFQPLGPYYLAGSSFGGLVAYEMARQLTASGQPVALVALFDTSVPEVLNLQANASGWRRRLDSALYRCRLHWGNIMVLDPSERPEYLRNKVRHFLGRRQLPERIRLTQEAVQWAASRYVPQKYSGKVTLFRATEQPPWIFPDPLLGWGSLAIGGVEVYRTPGHHADLVRNPRAQVLAHQLQDALLKVRHDLTDISFTQDRRDF
jgi:aspartate racemase